MLWQTFYDYALIMARDFGEPVFITQKYQPIPEGDQLDEEEEGAEAAAEAADEGTLRQFNIHAGRPANYRKECWRVMPDGRLFHSAWKTGNSGFAFRDITTVEVKERYDTIRNRGKTKKQKAAMAREAS